jgi:predicted restriction endonuclease
MIPKEKLEQILIRNKFVETYGEKCAVCGSVKKCQVHHIIPKRVFKNDADDNLICLCHAHHKVADRISLNEFQHLSIINEPKDKESLVAFLKLIELSQTQKPLKKQKKHDRKEKFEDYGNLPPPDRLTNWLKNFEVANVSSKLSS